MKGRGRKKTGRPLDMPEEQPWGKRQHVIPRGQEHLRQEHREPHVHRGQDCGATERHAQDMGQAEKVGHRRGRAGAACRGPHRPAGGNSRAGSAALAVWGAGGCGAVLWVLVSSPQLCSVCR